MRVLKLTTIILILDTNAITIRTTLSHFLAQEEPSRVPAKLHVSLFALFPSNHCRRVRAVLHAGTALCRSPIHAIAAKLHGDGVVARVNALDAGLVAAI